jgi:hypothetical protein
MNQFIARRLQREFQNLTQLKKKVLQHKEKIRLNFQSSHENPLKQSVLKTSSSITQHSEPKIDSSVVIKRLDNASKRESLLHVITEFEFSWPRLNLEWLFIKDSIFHDRYPSDRKLTPATENITTLGNKENKSDCINISSYWNLTRRKIKRFKTYENRTVITQWNSSSKQMKGTLAKISKIELFLE